MSMADLDELARRAGSQDGRGGRRPGAGRPKKNKTEPAKPAVPVEPPLEIRSVDQLLEEGPPPPIEDTGALTLNLLDNPSVYYATGKARKELAHAAKAELEYRIKLGQYLPRDAVRSAVATAFQAVAQGLRSIPDNLERKLGVSPELAEAVSRSIDDTMGELAHELERIFNENNDRDDAK